MRTYWFATLLAPKDTCLQSFLPKGRDLVFVSSMTRVDSGQQDQMKEHMNEEPEVWSEWVHECRLSLMRAELDWGIHMGHDGKEKPGPLQAFNVSLPIWFDGLNKNALMHSLRRLWLAKLSMIHEIKFAYGPGKESRALWTIGPTRRNRIKLKTNPLNLPKLSTMIPCHLARGWILKNGPETAS